MSRATRRVISVIFLAVLVYFAIALYSGLGKIAASLQHFAWWTFAAACGLASANYVLRFLKWEYYLSVLGIRGVPKGESFLTFLSGFVLTVTPGKVGEVFKSLILFQLRGVPIQRTAPIVVAERLTDLIGVIALIAVGSVSFRGGSSGRRVAPRWWSRCSSSSRLRAWHAASSTSSRTCPARSAGPPAASCPRSRRRWTSSAS